MAIGNFKTKSGLYFFHVWVSSFISIHIALYSCLTDFLIQLLSFMEQQWHTIRLHWAQNSKVNIMRLCSGGGCGKLPEVEVPVLIIAPARSPL